MFARREDIIFAPAPVLLGVDMASNELLGSFCDWSSQWEMKKSKCDLVANNVDKKMKADISARK
jgi:hypothetical protein